MIYYPISTLLELGIDQILIITNKRDQKQFQNLLGNGKDLGIKIYYKTQEKPNGIAEGLIIAEEFINEEPFTFILGDNLFIGEINQRNESFNYNNGQGATIFTYKVTDPERYGVVLFDNNNKPSKIIEKPKKSLSSDLVTGIYMYDNKAIQIAKKLKPSSRNELEITDVNEYYLNNNLLKTISLYPEVTWLDAGTVDSLYEASNLISTIEKRTGKKVGCIEEVALKKKLIGIKQFTETRVKYGNSEYGIYLQKIINNY